MKKVMYVKKLHMLNFLNILPSFFHDLYTAFLIVLNAKKRK